jgi:hypothetical protein
VLRIFQLLLLAVAIKGLLILTREDPEVPPIELHIEETCKNNPDYDTPEDIAACVEKNLQIMDELLHIPEDDRRLLRQCRKEAVSYDFEAQKKCMDEYRERNQQLDTLLQQ